MPTVRVIFCLWSVQVTRVVRRVPHFGAGIVWGTIPSGFPVFWIIVSGCSRNGYGTSPNLWVQKKLVKLWQGTQDAWLCSANFIREFFNYSAFNLLRKLGDVILSQFRVKRVLSSTVSSAFMCFSRNCCYFLLISERCHQTRGKLFISDEDWIWSLSLINSVDLLLLWGKRVSINTNSQVILSTVQYRKATIYILMTVLLFLLFIPFLGGKHNCLHAKSRYK